MSCLYFIVAIVLVPLVSGQGDVCLDLQNRRDSLEQYQQLGLSPFGANIYHQVSSGGILDKLFNSSISADEAEDAFLNSGMVFKRHFEIPEEVSAPKLLSEAAKNFFAVEASPFEYFRVIVNTMENFLKTRNILTPHNCQNIAEMYLQLLQDSMNSVAGISINSLSSRYLLNSVHKDFFDKLTKITPDDGSYILKTLADEFNNIRSLRKQV